MPCETCKLNCSKAKKVLSKQSLQKDNIVMVILDNVHYFVENFGATAFTNKEFLFLKNCLDDVNLQNVYFTHAVKCHIPKQLKNDNDIVKECRHYLQKEVNFLKPVKILCLGGVAISTLLKRQEIFNNRGVWQKYQNIDVMLTFSESFVYNNQNYLNFFLSDIRKFANGANYKNPNVNFTLVNDLETLKYANSRMSAWSECVCDIETTGLDIFDANTLITTVGFTSKGETFVFVLDHFSNADKIYKASAKTFLAKFLSSDRTFIFHNSLFDVTMLETKLGVKIKKFHDTMLQHYVSVSEMQGIQGLKTLASCYTEFQDYENELDKTNENMEFFI